MTAETIRRVKTWASQDERETYENLRRPGSIAVLIERLGLSGDTYEVEALCRSIDALVNAGHIEVDPTPGFSTIRWRRVS